MPTALASDTPGTEPRRGATGRAGVPVPELAEPVVAPGEHLAARRERDRALASPGNRDDVRQRTRWPRLGFALREGAVPELSPAVRTPRVHLATARERKRMIRPRTNRDDRGQVDRHAVHHGLDTHGRGRFAVFPLPSWPDPVAPPRPDGPAAGDRQAVIAPGEEVDHAGEARHDLGLKTRQGRSVAQLAVGVVPPRVDRAVVARARWRGSCRPRPARSSRRRDPAPARACGGSSSSHRRAGRCRSFPRPRPSRRSSPRRRSSGRRRCPRHRTAP